MIEEEEVDVVVAVVEVVGVQGVVQVDQERQGGQVRNDESVKMWAWRGMAFSILCGVLLNIRTSYRGTMVVAPFGLFYNTTC